jgi:KUP system potassium uptake protein
MTAASEEKEKNAGRRRAVLAFTALGVVFGDIGTSPLYALKVCFTGARSVYPSATNVEGVLSLILWSLILVVSFKYLLIVLRADNQGEGGILALTELVLPKKGRQRAFVLGVGLFGAALLYGDGAITPAISVLSAVEGLTLAEPAFASWTAAITIAILFALFLLQSRGTESVGMLFGPVMLLWFLVLGVSGVAGIVRQPAVLAAVDPRYALRFLALQGFPSLFIVGAVFLTVTGGEALYADLGHFGRGPIRIAWFALVLPSLLLNYFGQGALLLADPASAVNPFFRLLPDWALYPLVVLAAAAAIIASQAIISGVFSLSFQAVQLGYLPRLQILHTSESKQGQIFIQPVNWALFAVTAIIVAGFRSSSALAAAYGVAVSTTMVITTALVLLVMRYRWQWPLWAAVPAAGIFFAVDIIFFGANMLKIGGGAWLPLALAAAVYVLMSTWSTGRTVIAKQLRQYVRPLRSFLEGVDLRTVKRVSGTAVYLTSSPLTTPPAFVLNVQHNKTMHDRILFLYVGYKNVPHIRAEERIRVQKLPRNAYRVIVRYGFMDRTDIRAVMRVLDNRHLKIDQDKTTFFVSRDTMIPTRSIGMSLWRDHLFLLMRRNSTRVFRYFNLPPERVFEIGAQIKF